MLHAPHSCIIVGNFPLYRPGERLRNFVFSDAQGARLKPVDHDFEFWDPGGEVLRDQAICVAQSCDAGLDDQVDRGAVFEESRAHEIKLRSHIDHHVFEVLLGDCEQLVDGFIGGLKLGKLAGSREHGYSRAMLDQELGEKTRIQPAEILKSVDGREFGDDPEVERGVSQRKIEIDQQGALAGLQGQSYRIIAGNGGDTFTGLGAEKHQQPAARLFREASCPAAGRDPNQSLGHGALGKRQSEKLASARAHAADRQFQIGLHRIDHHSRRAVSADALHQFQGVFGVAVQVNGDDVVMLLQQHWHIVEAGRVGSEFTDIARLASGKSGRCRLAALLVRADQRNRQEIGSKGVGIPIVETQRRV